MGDDSAAAFDDLFDGPLFRATARCTARAAPPAARGAFPRSFSRHHLAFAVSGPGGLAPGHDDAVERHHRLAPYAPGFGRGAPARPVFPPGPSRAGGGRA